MENFPRLREFRTRAATKPHRILNALIVRHLFSVPTGRPDGRSRGAGDGRGIVNGEISGGFGLIAYPDEYGRAGIMTFMVNQNGVVYQKDLGENTLKLAAGLET